jgi:hypothetical protein
MISKFKPGELHKKLKAIGLMLILIRVKNRIGFIINASWYSYESNSMIIRKSL